MPETTPTTGHWRPASEPPECPAGESVPVIVARKSSKEKWYVFGAQYLNGVVLEDEGQEEVDVAVGFHVDFKHDYYDTFYESVDAHFWMPMPAPPSDLETGGETDAKAR